MEFSSAAVSLFTIRMNSKFRIGKQLTHSNSSRKGAAGNAVANSTFTEGLAWTFVKLKDIVVSIIKIKLPDSLSPPILELDNTPRRFLLGHNDKYYILSE